MAKTGKFYHYVSNITPVLSIGTSYNAAKRQEFNMWERQSVSTEFNGNLESLFLTVDGIAGGCSALTVRVCIDANGDYSCVGDVEVAIDLGITTPTVGTAQVLIGIPFKNVLGAAPNILHVFFKCDAGTCNIATGQLNWSE